MQLIKIDMVGLEPLQRPLNGFGNGLAGNRRAVAGMFHAFTGVFGCEYPFVATTCLLEPIAKDLFGQSDCFLGNRVHRIHLGGIDEIDSSV